MENKTKAINNVTVRQIIGQFWNGIKPSKGLYFSANILFFISQIIGVFIPLFYKDFFDEISTSTDNVPTAFVLVKIVIAILILHLLNWLFYRYARFLLNVVETKIIARLKQNAFNYTIKHSYTFFANNFGGSLVQKIGRFGRAFENLADMIAFNILPLIINVVGSILVVWFVAPTISIIITIWVVIFTVFNITFSTWKLKYDLIASAADSKTTGYLADSITNNTAVSFFTGYDYESECFKGVSNDQAKKILVSWNISDFVDAVQALLMILVEFFVFYYAIKYWEVGLITVGTFVLAQTYIIGLSERLWGLNVIMRNIYQSIADSKEMVEILLTDYEIKDVPNAKKLVVSKGEIFFGNASYEFNKYRKVLNNLNITIKPKEKVAIIGPSGAGKTTFVRLIMRVYNLTKGVIKIDDQDISQVSQDSLRENISFVPQDPVLFHRTLMDNIRYGRRGASDEEVKEAAHLAHCDEFINNLPLKYDTFVGERGIKLSGGERQRIAIARAILKKAPILIFDEATSSLDSHSEFLIQDALKNLMSGCTTIVVAHRLSTVKKMDRILSMEDGIIVEDGTHDELSNKESGLYKKLWDLQVGGFL